MNLYLRACYLSKVQFVLFMSIQTFFWSGNCTILVCKLCFLLQVILDLWPVLILEILSSWAIKKGQFQFLVTFFSCFFLTCKLYKSGLYITTYFKHGQCFIWGFLVFFLVFSVFKYLKFTFSSDFSWAGNVKVLVYKSYMPGL